MIETMSAGDWITVATVILGWVGSVVVAYTQRREFEVRLSARFDQLERELARLAGADVRLATLEVHRELHAQRLDAVERRVAVVDGNVRALAGERDVRVRQGTPGPEEES